MLINFIDIENAKIMLKENKLIIVKTNTIYGIIGRANNIVKDKIDKLKNRDLAKPISVALSEINKLLLYVNKENFRKINIFKPILKNITIVLSVKKNISVLFNLNTIGFRILDNLNNLTKLLNTYDCFLTSLNISGKQHINFIENLPIPFKNFPILEEKSLFVFDEIPTTVIDLSTTTPKILRKGSKYKESISIISAQPGSNWHP